MLILKATHDADCLSFRPPRLRDRFIARLCAWGIDKSIARGDCPDTSPHLSLRASRLISPRTQRKLARELKDILRQTGRRPDRLDRRGRVFTDEVIRSRPALEALLARLALGGPVDPRGIARTRILLRDGDGPLYNDRVAGWLGQVAQAAIDTLDPVLGLP